MIGDIASADGQNLTKAVNDPAALDGVVSQPTSSPRFASDFHIPGMDLFLPLIGCWLIWKISMKLLGKLTEFHALTEFGIRESITKTTQKTSSTIKTFRDWHLRNRYGKMTEGEYESEKTRRHIVIQKYERRRKILRLTAERYHSSSSPIAKFYIRNLKKRDHAYEDLVAKDRSYLAEIDWQRNEFVKKIIIKEMRSLGSSSTHRAARALVKLRAFAKSCFDWSGLIPKNIPEKDRTMLKNLLSRILGTDNIPEAQLALSHFIRILRNYNIEWEASA